MAKIVQYNRNKAVAYANKWAYGRNPKYYDFSSLGGDCTNFISQCLYSGSGIMNYTKTFGWYYNSIQDRTPSWSGVEFLYNFLVKNKTRGVFAKEIDIGEIMIGDIIQLGRTNNEYYHSLIVTQTGDNPDYSNILVNTHTFDASKRHLDTYVYDKIRFLHIEGVYK